MRHPSIRTAPLSALLLALALPALAEIGQIKTSKGVVAVERNGQRQEQGAHGHGTNQWLSHAGLQVGRGAVSSVEQAPNRSSLTPDPRRP